MASRGLKALLQRGGPVVMVNRRAGDQAGLAPFVGIDNAAAGAEAADFLLDAGVERPALIHSSFAFLGHRRPRRGFLRRLEARGLARCDIRVAASERLRHLEAGYEAAQRLVASGGWPEGLMCTSDQMAYGAYRSRGKPALPYRAPAASSGSTRIR